MRKRPITQSVEPQGQGVRNPDVEPVRQEYSTSPFRWYFEAKLVEFKTLRDEVIVVKQQVERTYLYMLTTTAAILASQVVSTTISSYLSQHPSMYIFVAILTLWFPAHVFTLNVDITTIGTYVRERLEPELALIADEAIGATTSEPLLSRKLRPLGWEEFLTHERIGGDTYGYLISPIYAVKNLFLYIPAAFLVYLYAVSVSSVRSWDWLLVSVLGLIVLILLFAYGGRGGLLAFARRRGAFRTEKVRRVQKISNV